MKKVAFHIQKGGVGKTTISGNVAFSVSRDKKTIYIDTDPQGNASSWLLTAAPQYELSDILNGTVSALDAIVKIDDNFHIIPTFAIDGKLKDYAETKLFREPFIFDDLCGELDRAGYEIAIFDLSPGMSQLERAVIAAVDEVITPLTPEYFSLDGIEIFRNELDKLNKAMRKNVRHEKIVCNGLNRSFSAHNDIYREFESLKYKLFTIPQDRKIADAQLFHKSIFEYNPESKSIPELKRLAGEIWH